LNEETFLTCQKLVDSLPHRPESHAVAALVYNRHGRTEEAVACWEKALQRNASFAAAYCGLGIVAADKGDYAEAVPLLRKAVALDPRESQSQSLLVDVLLRQGKAEEAKQAALDFVNHFPEAGESHYWLGQVYLDQGQFELARRSHERAIQIDVNYTQAYYSLATACARLKDREQARAYRERFAELKERDLEKDRSQSRTYRDLPEQRELAASYHVAAGNVQAAFGDPRMAEAHWLRGAQIAPDHPPCREALVKFYQQRNRPLDALEQLEDLLAAAPDQPAYLTQRGKLLADLGQWDAAERAWRKVIANAPDQADGYAHLVELYLRYGRPIADVIPLAERAVVLSPTGDHYLRLSAVRDKHGDRDGAITAARRAVAAAPQDDLARRVYESLIANP
jgi:tetratricopeptide (TPR) repeat protein